MAIEGFNLDAMVSNIRAESERLYALLKIKVPSGQAKAVQRVADKYDAWRLGFMAFTDSLSRQWSIFIRLNGEENYAALKGWESKLMTLFLEYDRATGTTNTPSPLSAELEAADPSLAEVAAKALAPGWVWPIAIGLVAFLVIRK